MLRYQGAQNIGLSNHRFKFVLKCTIYKARPSHSQTDGQTDRQQTDEHHGSDAMIRSTNASRTKKRIGEYFVPCHLLTSLHAAVLTVEKDNTKIRKRRKTE